MKARLRNGKVFTGKLAKILVNRKVAEVVSDSPATSQSLAEKKLTAKEIVQKIENSKSIDDLSKFESDKRQLVRNALNKKLKEFKS